MKKFYIDPQGRFAGITRLVYEKDANGEPRLIQIIDNNQKDIYKELSKDKSSTLWVDMTTFHLGTGQKVKIE